jgi:protein PhnA
LRVSGKLAEFRKIHQRRDVQSPIAQRARFIRGLPVSALPACPTCQSEYTYEDGGLYICPECAHEWSAQDTAAAVAASDEARVYRDSAGNVLQDGDTITVIKDLKLKGSSGVVKMGTKVKGIRLVDSDHDIDCKIDGFGQMSLKSEFVKKI